ncbi:peptidase C14, caspase domain-containing protein [Russula vinacea]|nr:peptidase C14, caspase domain-containing protein [Russula vinacea]
MRKRRALIIGINYSLHPDPRSHLKHCVEDAYNMAEFLCANLDFVYDNIRIMTDATSWDLPTKENILRAMLTLVHDAQPHDSLFFYCM